MTEQQLRTANTRGRLLEAAAEVYAEQGYRAARVREICDRAGANVAAINYHFGDKQRLYYEVLRYAFFSLAGEDPTHWANGEGLDPEQRLRAFVESFLAQLLGEGRSALYAKLVAQEMLSPTPALERVIEEGIRPQTEIVFSVIRDVLGDVATEQLVRRCAASVLGQCLFYYFARPVILYLPLEDRLDRESIDGLTDHVTRFSMAAIGQIARDGRES